MLEKRLGREVALRMAYETETEVREVALIFEGVEAFRVTYDRARGDAMLEAYDCLLSLGRTPWLVDVSENLERHGASPIGLDHLIINFDDGPCYEVICRSHRID